MTEYSQPRIASFGELSGRVRKTGEYSFDVLSMTALNFDHLYTVDDIKEDYEVAVARVVSSPGGSGANTAAALARLGASTGIAGIVADDNRGEQLRWAVSNDGTDSRNVLVGNLSDGPTGEAVVLAKGRSYGSRMIVVNAGINNHYASTLKKRHKYETLLKFMTESRIVHLTSFAGTEERKLQLELLKDLGPDAVISLNPGMIYSRLGIDHVGEFLGRANILFVYENMIDSILRVDAREGLRLSEKLAKLGAALEVRGYELPGLILVKRSWSEGQAHYVQLCEGLGANRYSCSARFAAAENLTIDPTGAGDAMAAGILFSLLNGYDAQDAVDLAYVMAVSASTKVGARNGLPNRGDLREAWQDYLGAFRASPHWLT